MSFGPCVCGSCSHRDANCCLAQTTPVRTVLLLSLALLLIYSSDAMTVLSTRQSSCLLLLLPVMCCLAPEQHLNCGSSLKSWVCCLTNLLNALQKLCATTGCMQQHAALIQLPPQLECMLMLRTALLLLLLYCQCTKSCWHLLRGNLLQPKWFDCASHCAMACYCCLTGSASPAGICKTPAP